MSKPQVRWRQLESDLYGGIAQLRYPAVQIASQAPCLLLEQRHLGIDRLPNAGDVDEVAVDEDEHVFL
jgi:hypothetical protein